MTEGPSCVCKLTGRISLFMRSVWNICWFPQQWSYHFCQVEILGKSQRKSETCFHNNSFVCLSDRDDKSQLLRYQVSASYFMLFHKVLSTLSQTSCDVLSVNPFCSYYMIQYVKSGDIIFSWRSHNNCTVTFSDLS